MSFITRLSSASSPPRTPPADIHHPLAAEHPHHNRTMDMKGCVFVTLAIVNCLFAVLVSAAPEADRYAPARANNGLVPADKNAMRVEMLEKMLRDDIDRELEDIERLAKHHETQKEWYTQKKRQLEIKKRRPVQCLVNIVSCWKK